MHLFIKSAFEFNRVAWDIYSKNDSSFLPSHFSFIYDAKFFLELSGKNFATMALLILIIINFENGSL